VDSKAECDRLHLAHMARKLKKYEKKKLKQTRVAKVQVSSFEC